MLGTANQGSGVPKMAPITFTINDKIYSTEDCKWINRYSNKKKNAFYPPKRAMHATAIYEDHLYLFGGSEKLKVYENVECVFKLDFSTWDWERVTRVTQPKPRDSFGNVSVGSKFYLFGGSDFDSIYNDMWCFNFEGETWQLLHTHGQVPSERDCCLMSSINDTTLFLLGGMNSNQHRIYSDGYLFDTDTNKWTKLTLREAPPPAIMQSLCRCGSKLYLFGGFNGINGKENYINQLYSIDVDTENCTATFQLVEAKNKPSKRSTHGMIDLGDDNTMILIGGEGETSMVIEGEQREEEETSAKEDVWVYSIKEKQWRQVFPKNASFRARFGFSISRLNNQIYLFGGLRNHNNLYDQLMILIFNQDKDREKQALCTRCQTNVASIELDLALLKGQTTVVNPMEKVVETKPESDAPTQASRLDMPLHFSNTFLSQVAKTQLFAFSAVGLLVDCAVLLQSDWVRVALKQYKQTFEYLKIQFDGQKLVCEDFMKVIGNERSASSLLKSFASSLKLGAFRLGNTLVYVSRYLRPSTHGRPPKRIACVALLSVSSNVVPLCNSEYRYFCYSINLDSGQFLTETGPQNRDHIYNYLSSHIADIDQLIREGPAHSIFVFQMKLLTCSKNVFYYEMISRHPSDVQILVNSRKVEFLDQIGYAVSGMPDLSLSTYLSILHLHPVIKIYVNQNTQPVQPFLYVDHLNQLANQNKLYEFPSEKLQVPQAKSIRLFTTFQNLPKNPLIPESGFVHRNFGCLIYHKNRLINRYNTEFGKLFSDKFYKNKYKPKPTNLFKHMGVIQLHEDLIKTNLVKTDVENNQFSISLWSKFKFVWKELKTVPPALNLKQGNQNSEGKPMEIEKLPVQL